MGLEPTTPALQRQCATNCATPPGGAGKDYVTGRLCGKSAPLRLKAHVEVAALARFLRSEGPLAHLIEEAAAKPART